MANLKLENFQKNLHYIVNSTEINNFCILSICLYININNT